MTSTPSPSPQQIPKRSAWLPIRSLTARHRVRVVEHLRALDAHDRYLRFGFPARDEQIERYVEAIDFRRDELFGVFDRRLELLALAHLAFASHLPADDTSAELGISVLPRARGRGFGARLFDHATLRARNRGIETLRIHALSENAAVLSIARSAGATLVRDGAEVEARLELPPGTPASHLDSAIAQTAAEIDFQLKAQARVIDNWLSAIDEMATQLKRNATPGVVRE